jgi:2-desacetyl-2-hydroxyethyl bacteriochlorophyllide A dehydrogenase
MKALVYLGPREMELRDVEPPVPAADEVLLKVLATGICGSDVHGYLGVSGRRVPPMTMGHEFCGSVEKAGLNVKRYRKGDRVVVQPVIFCGTCSFCKQGLTNLCTKKRFLGVLDCNGSMAELLSVPEKLLYKLPDSCDDSLGAMVEPLAVAFRAVSKVSRLIKGSDVVIVGAGTIGLLLLTLVRLHGAASITVSDVNGARLSIAEKLGAGLTVNPKSDDLSARVLERTGGRGADIAFEAVGMTPTVQQAMACLKPGGTCIWVGNSQKEIQVDMQASVTRELSVRGSYIYTHEEFGDALKVLVEKKIDVGPIISATVPLREAAAMFKTLCAPGTDLVKVIIRG